MDVGFKKLHWVGAGAVFLLLLLCTLAFIAPRVVDSAWLKATIKTNVAKQITGEFDFQKADLAILPYPAVSLQQVSLSIPLTAQIHLETLKVYPRLLPLLIGKINLDKIVLNNPDLSLALPQKSAERTEAGKALPQTAFPENILTKLSPVLAALSGLDIGIEQGTLRIFSGDVQLFLVENINCEFKISEQTLAAAISSFTARYKNEKIIAQVENLIGRIQNSAQISTLTVDDLSFSYPQVQLSGTFTFDHTEPHASLDISSQTANIAEIREVLPVFINALYGEQPLVRQIFDITRSGTISQAGFHVEGKTSADLAVFESMSIQAHVKDGEILLSDLGLDLQGVTGNIVIANGILEGNNLMASLGNSTGSKGNLKLGLVQKDTTPFHLDLDLNADLSEVPPVLKQLTPKKQILYYLSLIESIEGTGQGRLTLGESLESLTVRAEADKIFGQANYKPIPFPVTINGGRILYDGLKTHSFDLQGKIGKSTFTNYSARLNLEGEPSIEVESGSLHLVLDEIYPWLRTQKKLEDDLSNIKNITGLAEVTVKSINGPLLQPTNLHFDLECVLRNVTLSAPALPGPLRITSGKANFIPDKIVFENLQAALQDSSLAYSAVLQDFMLGKTNADIIITKAEIGPEVNNWLSEQINVPKEYIFRTPLLVSRSHVKWTSKELLDLQGDFSLKDGPIFSIDVMLNPDELILHSLALKNGAEKAKIKLALKRREINAEFQGSLSKSTIDKILLYNDLFPDAWIKGDMKFYFNMHSPAESIASGKLDGGNFIFPWKVGKPLLLESFSLSASDKTLKLKSAEADFDGNKFAMSGQTSLNQERLAVDFDVMADTIELGKILEALPKEDEENTEENKRVGKSWNLAVKALVNFHANSLHYKNYTWKPFESKVTLEDNALNIEVLKAELCNISTPGKFSFRDGQISLDLTMEANKQEYREVLICLEGGKQQMTGVFNLNARISGQGSSETLINSLQGDMLLSAKEGYIYQDAKMAKLLSFLSVTNMFQGKIPDLSTEGFHYDSLIVKGEMEKGVLAIEPAKLAAPIMEIAGSGTINIPEEKVDFQFLVAPLQTVNKIQKNLPVIRQIIPSSIIALPVEVKGDFSDIKVRTLSMTSISSRVFNIMMDTLSTPVRVLEKAPRN